MTNMTNMNRTLPIVALSLLLLASCTRDDIFRSNENDGEFQYVTVGIDVSAGSLDPMTGSVSPATKSSVTVGLTEDIVCDAVLPEAEISVETRAAGINDPEITANTTIKNLWVLQYDGTGDAAKLIGTPVYIEDYTEEANRSAKLVASTTPNTIVFIANTFDKNLPFQQNSTITELKGRRFTTQSLGTIVTKDPNTADTGTGTFPNDGDYYQRLNGYVETTITEGDNLECALGHNACRISVNVTNNTAGTTYPVTLTSADIENVPGCMYFFTNYDGYTSGTNVGKPTGADIALYELKNYYNVITWTAEEGTSATAKSAKLYLSPNESGIVSANVSPKLKSMFAPSRATVLRLHGTYKDGGNDIPVKYTFALGEDMIKNYQLVPNGDYVYNITLNARGDKTSDGRVTYNSASGIDYTQTTVWPLSNCYICNPPAVESASCTYRIPVARVDQFWGGGDYENVANNCLGQTNAWTVSVIWSDMKVKADNFVITKDTGNGKDDYFEVSIPGTTEMGNVVIGIKNTLSPDWLWSWHLWVTDYCPDDAKYLTQQGAFLPGTDTYHVTGGDVQRYQAAAAGEVQKVYMDRNVGAMSTNYVGYGKGTLYYQFGRKDPFPGNATYWEGGTVEQTDGFIVSKTKKNVVANTDTDNPPSNVPYSVQHPTTFITGSYWTYKDKYNPEQYNSKIVWQDPNSSNLGNKSIFDPSPSGWKVPVNFNGTTSNSVSAGFQIINTSIVSGGASVKYHLSGIRHYNYGSLNYEGGATYYATSSSNSIETNNYQAMPSWYHSTNENRATGYQVRPILE